MEKETKIKNETVTIEELAISNMYELEALINVLLQKGLITKEEILLEVKNLQEERNKKIN